MCHLQCVQSVCGVDRVCTVILWSACELSRSRRVESVERRCSELTGSAQLYCGLCFCGDVAVFFCIVEREVLEKSVAEKSCRRAL